MKNNLPFLCIFFVLFGCTYKNNTLEIKTSPEKTLSKYIACLEKADEECVLENYAYINSFHISDAEKIQYRIEKKRTITLVEVETINRNGTVPSYSVGDVQFDVHQSFTDYEGMWTYTFRQIEGKWQIISHFAWPKQ